MEKMSERMVIVNVRGDSSCHCFSGYDYMPTDGDCCCKTNCAQTKNAQNKNTKEGKED